MKPITSFLFLLPLTVFLSLLPHLLAVDQTNSTNLIAKACENSSHKEFCVASLESSPDSQNADLPGLAFIALKLASSNATDTATHISKVLGAGNLEPLFEQALTDCSEHYLDAIEQIDDSLAALTAKAYKDVESWVDVALSDAQACEEGFKGQDGDALALTRRNRVFRQLCNNALVINKLLA
ncbi:hypothetical protein L1049_005421 [Liquidambar formosana]|uniref:Pectinesterase inhibitor domain-containing protein n=1 Tax=Liquidambar formosana TaxID=63359 RepID=A0AAP0WXM5_LIQFO